MMQNDGNTYIASLGLFRTSLSLFSLGDEIKIPGSLIFNAIIYYKEWLISVIIKETSYSILIDLLKFISIKICLTEMFFAVAWYWIWHVKRFQSGSPGFFLKWTVSISFIPSTFIISGGPGFTRIEKWADKLSEVNAQFYNLTTLVIEYLGEMTTCRQETQSL